MANIRQPGQQGVSAFENADGGYSGIVDLDHLIGDTVRTKSVEGRDKAQVRRSLRSMTLAMIRLPSASAL